MQQQQESGFRVSYNTCHQKGKTESPLDRNNTKVDITFIDNSPMWD